MRMNRQSLDHQVWVKLLEERHKQSSGVFSAVLQSDQRDRNQDAGGGLISQLGARGKSEIAMMNDFKVVIGKTDRAKRHRGKHSDPHKRIAQVRPEQRRHQDRDGDQQAAHGRRASFLLVSLRTLFAYVLPNLEIAQPPNHDRPNDQSSEKSGEAGKGGAESQITENTEGRKVMEELQVEQPVEQSASNTSSVLSSQFPTPRAEGCRSFVLQPHAAISFSLCIPVDLCAPRGSGFCSSPRLQRFLQLHTARRLQQYDIALASLARQPLASFLRRRDKFRFHTAFASRFPHRLRQAPHAEQEFKFTSCNVTPALLMQFLARGAEFQHLAGDNKPSPRRHRCQSIYGSHKRLRT